MHNTVSRLRRSVALQGIGQQGQPAVATMIGGDLEGCGPALYPSVSMTHGRALPSQPSASGTVLLARERSLA